MERPVSIVQFERCDLGAAGVAFVNTAVSWNATIARVSDQAATARLGTSVVQTILIGSTLLSLAVTLVLWHFTARQGSVVTKWIIVGLFVIGTLGTVQAVIKGMVPPGFSGFLTVVVYVLSAIAVWLLFKPDSKRWFGESAV